MKQKKFQLAVSDYNKVLSINPKDLDALLDRAMSNFQLENDFKARDDLEKILEIDPNHPRAKPFYKKYFQN
jgi:Flp pilus assembly protein TadD